MRLELRDVRSSETVWPEQQRGPGLGSKWRSDGGPGKKAADTGRMRDSESHLHWRQHTCLIQKAGECEFALSN